MFCYKCGKELVDGASFCTSCGTAIVHHHCQKTDQNVKSTPVDLTQNTNSNSENESKKKTKKQKTNLSIRTKNKVSIYIDDENLCKRKPLIYFNNGGGSTALWETHKATFTLECECKISASVQSLSDSDRLKSNEIVIPNGKITDVKMFIDEENNLVLEIISQRDYSGSKEEAADIEKVRRGKLTKRIIIGIVLALSFALVCSIIMAFDSSIHYKSLAEDCILSDVQGLCGEDFELKNVTYTSTETQYFTNLEEYGLLDYLLKHRYIGENGTEYSDGIEYFESRGVDVYNSTKRASILKGTYEVSDGSVSLIGDFDIVIIELGNVSFTTLCYIEGVTVSETDAMTLAKNHLLTKINFSTLNDIELYFVDCTFSTTEVIGTNNYKFYGKVTAKDPYGNLYTANYEAMVNRGDLYNQCEVDIDLGGFSKQ